MRTTVRIDDALLREARSIVRGVSHSDLINRALKSLIQEVRRQELLDWIRHGRTGFSLKKLERMRRPRA